MRQGQIGNSGCHAPGGSSNRKFRTNQSGSSAPWPAEIHVKRGGVMRVVAVASAQASTRVRTIAAPQAFFVWLIPILYPLSLSATFRSAELTRTLRGPLTPPPACSRGYLTCRCCRVIFGGAGCLQSSGLPGALEPHPRDLRIGGPQGVIQRHGFRRGSYCGYQPCSLWCAFGEINCRV